MAEGDFRNEVLQEISLIDRALKSADNLVYVTFPVVRDEKIFSKAIEEIDFGIRKLISLILKFEYVFRKLSLGKSSEHNLKIFFDKCSQKYGLDRVECATIKEIISYELAHKSASMELSMKGKRVFLDENMKRISLNQEKMKVFIKVFKVLLENFLIEFKRVF